MRIRTLIAIDTLILAIVGIVLLGLVTYHVLYPIREVIFTSPPLIGSGSISGGTGAVHPEGHVQVPKDEPVTSDLPDRVRIDMTFVSQAPHGNWAMPYQEACEESSLLLVHHYLSNTPINEDTMGQGILELVEWENGRFGYSADLTLEEVGIVAQERFGHTTEIIYEPTLEDLKRELAEGNPIILPLAGRMLGNPYYSGEGPWYHMLVVTGYDGSHFITNDVGTRRGESYKYRYATIMNAIHNWTGAKEDIVNGRSAMLVVTR